MVLVYKILLIVAHANGCHTTSFFFFFSLTWCLLVVYSRGGCVTLITIVNMFSRIEFITRYCRIRHSTVKLDIRQARNFQCSFEFICSGVVYTWKLNFYFQIEDAWMASQKVGTPQELTFCWKLLIFLCELPYYQNGKRINFGFQ